MTHTRRRGRELGTLLVHSRIEELQLVVPLTQKIGYSSWVVAIGEWDRKGQGGHIGCEQ